MHRLCAHRRRRVCTASVGTSERFSDMPKTFIGGNFYVRKRTLLLVLVALLVSYRGLLLQRLARNLFTPGVPRSDFGSDMRTDARPSSTASAPPSASTSNRKDGEPPATANDQEERRPSAGGFDPYKVRGSARAG